MLRSNGKSLGNHVVSPEEEKDRLQWEGFAHIFHIATTLEQAHSRSTKLGGLPERHLAHQSWPPIISREREKVGDGKLIEISTTVSGMNDVRSQVHGADGPRDRAPAQDRLPGPAQVAVVGRARRVWGVWQQQRWRRRRRAHQSHVRQRLHQLRAHRAALRQRGAPTQRRRVTASRRRAPAPLALATPPSSPPPPSMHRPIGRYR